MDNKFSNKTSNFFKREGFYVVLFLCLCIVATVAVVTTRNNQKVKEKAPLAKVEQKKEVVNVPKSAEKPLVDRDNALSVKGDNKTNTTAKDNTKTTAVSSVSNVKFVKPVEGTLARGYSNVPNEYFQSTESSRMHEAIDIKCDIGKAVVAVMAGKVEKISFDNDGWKVVINHENGLKTVYANLEEKVSVKEGQKVDKGQQLGRVGNTTLNTAYEKYGSHLHFQVFNNNQYVDPAKYVKY